jgi:hypothetical protein
MKSLFLGMAMLMTGLACAQHSYRISKDAHTGSLIFKGPLSINALREEPSFDWMRDGMKAYKPDADAVAYLWKNLPNYHLVVLLGTWCSDSHELIPKLATVLEQAEFPMQQLSAWGVDRRMSSGGRERSKFHLKKVPTIIVFKGNHELGRIVESVHASIETDLANIIRKDASRFQ